MPNIDQMYPSRWLKASDLQNKTFTLTIDRLAFEDVGDGDQKPILYFKGAEKGLVLNKTNATSIGMVYGQETEGWIGKAIQIFPTMVPFGSNTVPAIRVRPAAQAQSFNQAVGDAAVAQGPGEQATAQGAGNGGDLNEDIPF